MTLLVGHEANYSLDNGHAEPGLLYSRKQPAEGALSARIENAISSALKACQRLETEPSLENSVLFRGGETATESFAAAGPPFRRQADAFLDAIESRQPARNPPSDALVDVQIADAIATSSRDRGTVALPH